MEESQMSNSTLHYTIIRFIIDNGYAPELNELSQRLERPETEVATALEALQEYHGVVLHPNSHRIWVAHPFSLAPSNFRLSCDGREWWSSCAWCALGAAALLDSDLAITTTLGATDGQVTVHIEDGFVKEDQYVVHFPVPMRNAWDNVIYTCSTMLLFQDELQVDVWCGKHRIPKGDVQSISTIWEFSKVWYGNHLRPDWVKWTAAEASEIFARFGLTGDIWELPQSGERF